MESVGVRQAGGLGGDRPVCKLDGLHTEKNNVNVKCFEWRVFGSF